MSAQTYGRGLPSAGTQNLPSSAALNPGNFWSERHCIGSRLWHVADHPDTRYRCAGSVQESLGANMRSCNVNRCAYVQ